MMKRISSFLLMACLLPLPALAAIEIHGHIKTATGQAPALAHVHLTEIGGTYLRPMRTLQADRSGDFTLEIAKPGLYLLWVTAVDHHLASVPLLLEQAEERVEFTMTLAPYLYKEAFDEVKIIGDWNNFDFGTAETMQKQPDGTFTYDVSIDADTVAYQLLGITVGERSINGTMSERFVYDGGGDYRSVVKTEHGHAHIVFQPQKLYRAKDVTLPRVAFKDNERLAAAYRVYRLFIDGVEKFQRAAATYHDVHGDLTGFKFDFPAIRSELEQTMHESPYREVRELAAVYLVELPLYDTKLRPSDMPYREMFELLGPASPMWAIAPTYLVSTASAVDKEHPETILQQFVDQNPDRRVQAAALSTMLGRAAHQKDTSRVHELYARLKTEYGDVEEIKYVLQRYDPDRHILAGKPVPPFEVKLMGSDEVVSNKTLLGKYYLLDFWATWCGPCVAEMGNLHAAYEKFKGSNFELISFSFDGSPEKVAKFRQKKWRMPWKHVFVGGGFNSDIAKRFEVFGIPKPILVGPDGTILAVEGDLRGENLEQTLTRFLGSHASK